MMPQKAKILFVVAHMQMNGAMRSLLNLLAALDRSKYDLSLLIYAWGDVLMGQIPADIRLVPESAVLRIFDLPFGPAIKTAWQRRLYQIMALRISAGIKARITQDPRAKEKIWSRLKSIDDGYDVAIGFCEGSTHRFVLERVVAKKKVGWVHVDYGGCPPNVAVERETLAALDRIVTVSAPARDSIVRRIGIPDEKVVVIQSLAGEAYIRKCACTGALEKQKEECLSILTIGRLTHIKGMDIALEACKLLKDRLPRFRWLVIGEGHERPALEKAIKRYGLGGVFVLLGEQANPYPWLADCDIYVQPSRSESWGMTITEAKLFGKAIVAADIPAFREQIKNESTGLLVSLTPYDLARAIEHLVAEKEHRESLAASAMRASCDDKNTLLVFEEMIAMLRR